MSCWTTKAGSSTANQGVSASSTWNGGVRKDAPASADPYLCVVNGKETLLFGVDWTPIRPNFADLREEDYRQRLNVYRDCGMTVLRVWGGGFPEKECFYRLL